MKTLEELEEKTDSLETILGRFIIHTDLLLSFGRNYRNLVIIGIPDGRSLKFTYTSSYMGN